MKSIRKTTISLALALTCLPLSAVAQDINAEREHWALHARKGQAELAESVDALRKLYTQSKDTKVRADLIALLVRQGKQVEALAVCAECKPSNYTSDELENLAKAARDNKRFEESAALYAQLQRVDAFKKIGFLGGALASSEAGKHTAARNQIAEYRKRFGNDADITQAEEYINERSQSLSERLETLKQKLAKDPENKDLALQTYRTAAQLQAYPVQDELIQRYPKLFSQTDLLWLKLSKAVTQLRLSRETNDIPQLEAAYNSLNEVATQAPAGSDLQVNAIRDRMAASIALGKDKQALEDYNMLRRIGEQPQYVKEQYAQALSMNGSPITARSIYQEIMQQQKAETGQVSPNLTGKLVEADADAGYYTNAQERVKSWNPKKNVPDFTHTREIDNPYYDQQFFWNARLEAWNGNHKKAAALMDAWLAEHPGDPWAMILRGDLAYWNGRGDEAIKWYENAKDHISPESQIWVNNQIANVWMSTGNWAAVKEMASKLDRNDPAYKPFWEQYDKARAAQLNISGSAMKATSPKDGTEWGQSATLYSPRSQSGHRAYITEQTAYVPNNGDPLRSGRVGIGADISLHPVTVNVEAGHGTELNKKAYASIGADYRVNERISLNAKAAHNSANTPTKALQQKVYADEYNIGASYTHSANTRAGAGLGVMTFDDDNVRKSVYGWVSQMLYQRNRWKLDGSLWADYSSNKDTPSAYYYNPKNSKTVSGSLSLSYAMPLDNGIRLNQKLTGGVGRYWQADHSSENTWLLKYGHDWSLGKKTSLGYELGRKQAIYDGEPEFQNFGNVNLSVRFK
ncbi:poly-beta-1,6 N-acetyl-D-glucosamine export porin PgaA [Neisseria sp. 83E34]|uniref:poly-beta-1,6 N-acetyl-D-glucosamine export porin PgaA n=1 Tax=Neisseria sp. 83E34 TaxID=1692264 RepID=UPI0006CE69D5|nr:poly-beta-1,6 N-acetyl-D-glucosamine export porin PgaA [Neisseria sp. 83E34]KPN71477.1 hypothetical protein AKG09_06340 [Neisseria sp. 83E34]